MKQNVLRFGTDGSVQFLLKDSFFDTRFLGDRKIERISSIEFSEEKQKFYITWLKGPWAGFPEVEEIVYDNDTGIEQPKKIIWFDTYEQAVEHEINRVNKWRLAGHSFA